MKKKQLKVSTPQDFTTSVRPCSIGVALDEIISGRADQTQSYGTVFTVCPCNYFNHFQMPDALSSYPAITTNLTKDGGGSGVVSRPELVNSSYKKYEQLSSEKSLAGGRRKYSSSSCTSLHLSSTVGSRSRSRSSFR